MTKLTLLLLSATLFFSAPTSAQDSSMQAHQDMMTAMQPMMQQMQAMKPTGNPDADFTMMMIPHHQAAADMAKAYLKYGKDSEMRTMAEKIISGQEKEIAEMKKWQKEHIK